MEYYGYQTLSKNCKCTLTPQITSLPTGNYTHIGKARNIRRRHFGVFLFFLLTITDRNEAIIVELKELFVLNGPFITCSGGSHQWRIQNVQEEGA